jgi:2-oxoisovalerate dehydrogenase E1 component
MRGEIPEVADVHIPLGKGIVRNAGEDVTLVAWGRAVWTGLDAAKRLEAEGIGLEVIDLRTIVPPDMEMVLDSVKKTGRVLVASEDRTFGGFARQIQGDVVEQLPGTPSRSLGQKNIPGIGQSLILENATILTADDIVKAAHDVIAEGERRNDTGGKAGWGWVPPRYFVS